jgi:hypothetical protein
LCINLKDDMFFHDGEVSIATSKLCGAKEKCWVIDTYNSKCLIPLYDYFFHLFILKWNKKKNNVNIKKKDYKERSSWVHYIKGLQFI